MAGNRVTDATDFSWLAFCLYIIFQFGVSESPQRQTPPSALEYRRGSARELRGSSATRLTIFLLLLLVEGKILPHLTRDKTHRLLSIEAEITQTRGLIRKKSRRCFMVVKRCTHKRWRKIIKAEKKASITERARARYHARTLLFMAVAVGTRVMILFRRLLGIYAIGTSDKARNLPSPFFLHTPREELKTYFFIRRQGRNYLFKVFMIRT